MKEEKYRYWVFGILLVIVAGGISTALDGGANNTMWNHTTGAQPYTFTAGSNDFVGVGTSSPTAKLNVVGLTNTTYLWSNSLTLGAGQNMTWNDDYYTLNVPTGLGNTIQVGQELTLMRKNVAGQTIYSGQIVAVTGSQGEMITVGLADACNESLIKNVGMVTIPSCNNNAVCPVTYIGDINDLDTSAWAEGTELFLSGDGSGNLTDTLPGGSCYHINMGEVSRTHASAGIVNIHVDRVDVTDEPVFSNFHVLENVTVDGYVGIGKANHAFGGFENKNVVIDCTGAGVWANITNASLNLWEGIEADGVSLVNDAMIFADSGDYVGMLSLTMSGLNGKDFYVRIYDATADVQQGFIIGESTTGANNFKNLALPVYIEATEGNHYVLQVMNSVDAADPTIRSAMFEVHYLHE